MEEFNNNIGENANEQTQEANVNENQNPGTSNPVNQNANPGYQNPGFAPNQNPNINPNPGYQNPGYQYQNYQQQPYNPNNYQAPGYQNQGFQPNQGFQRPGFQNQGFQPPQGGIPGLFYSINLSGWATYYGVFKIIFGSLLTILSLLFLVNNQRIGIFLDILLMAVSVLIIVSGVKTINFTEAMKRYAQSKDTNRIAEAFNRLNQQFLVNGIMSIVLILFIIIVLVYAINTASSLRGFYFR